MLNQFFFIYAVDNDMYVIVDGHILEDNDPNINIDAAKAFFEMISSEYSSVPNIIYEICNEPNCDTDWNDVYGYSEQIIKIIRNNCTDSLILVGTPDYDRNLAPCVRKPLPYDNVMYVLHFYTASHHEGLQICCGLVRDTGRVRHYFTFDQKYSV